MPTSSQPPLEAPGCPGINPTWTSSDKDTVISALGPSRVWATIGHGIVNEVYWPSTGEPQIRDLGFIIRTPNGWYEIKRVSQYEIRRSRDHLTPPVFMHRGPGYEFEIEVVPDPLRDVLLIRYALTGDGAVAFVLLAPHLGSSGLDNSCRVEDDMTATQGPHALVLTADPGFGMLSAGFVGFSDGWQDFNRHGTMTWSYDQATSGNVALTGELPSTAGTLALGFGDSVGGTRSLALAALADGIDLARTRFTEGWTAWFAGNSLACDRADMPLVEASAAVLKSCVDRTYPGAIVASPSIPWGNTRNDIGGYHLVWARDAVQCAFAFLALGRNDDADQILSYLVANQHDDGHWAQNCNPDGRVFWKGVQLDEVAWPMLIGLRCLELDLVERRATVLSMLRKAAIYLANHGPVSDQDRWEEARGISTYSLAVQIAALLGAAELLDPPDRAHALSLARYWNARVEDWTFVQGGDLARSHGVDGHYLRIASADILHGKRGTIPIANRGGLEMHDDRIVSLGFLQLVRMGLRRPDDPRVTQSLVVADALLGVDTPSGRGYRRYNEDGYGEHADGSAFDGQGIGRLWPLLVGERGHHAAALGDDPAPFLDTIRRMSGSGGLVPEQVWDTEPIPSRGLIPGRPTGSAMPLLWAHAEYIKLATVRSRGAPIEQLSPMALANLTAPAGAPVWHWQPGSPIDLLPSAATVSIEFREPFMLHLGTDGWQNVRDLESEPIGLSLHAVRLDKAARGDARSLEFAARFTAGDTWSASDYKIPIGPD